MKLTVKNVTQWNYDLGQLWKLAQSVPYVEMSWTDAIHPALEQTERCDQRWKPGIGKTQYQF